MIRPLTLLSMAAAAGAGLYLYQVKHSVAQLDRELRGINRQTEQARERTQVLRAEWALLNEPDRLRQVAQRHLQLEAMTAAQFVRPAEMERRLPPPRQFAGTPSLFASVEPAGDGSATAIALAPAGTRPPATAEAMASAPAAPTTPGPALLPAAIASAAAAAPAALAAARAAAAPGMSKARLSRSKLAGVGRLGSAATAEAAELASPESGGRLVGRSGRAGKLGRAKRLRASPRTRRAISPEAALSPSQAPWPSPVRLSTCTPRARAFHVVAHERSACTGTIWSSSESTMR